jgi:hypothetical protein
MDILRKTFSPPIDRTRPLRRIWICHIEAVCIPVAHDEFLAFTKSDQNMHERITHFEKVGDRKTVFFRSTIALSEVSDTFLAQ